MIAGRIRTLGIGALVVLMAAEIVAGCSGIPQDDRYQTHDGGRSNSRAEAPGLSSVIRPS